MMCHAQNLCLASFFRWLGIFGPQLETPNNRAARDFYNQVGSRNAIHSFAHSRLTILSDQAGCVELGNQVVEIMVGLQNDVAAAAAVAAARAALWTKLFARKRHATFSAMAGAGIN